MTQAVAWYVNRLRCMTPAEVAHRALRALRVRLGQWLPAPGRAAAADLSACPPPWIRAPQDIDPAPYLAAADRLAAGRFDLFALREAPLGSPPQWNTDPKTGVRAPLAYGPLLDYRDSRVVGDIKYLWELNRHLHFVTLAQAYALTGEARHARALAQNLESWLDACPYPLGANWSSALEAGLRLISWSAAWQLLGHSAAAIPHLLRSRWLGSVYRHAAFVRANYSGHSSANNHLIGEAAGVFIAAATWPCWPQARAWRDEAQAILEREAIAQNAPDGVNREQAVGYQRFVLEMLLHSLLAGAACGSEFSAAFRARVEAMLEYLASIMDALGNVPMLGDCDDGTVLRLAPAGIDAPDPDRELLAAGALLFGRPEFRAKAGALAPGVRWLFPEAQAAWRGIDAGAALLPVRRRFTHGGVYVLGCNFETPAELRVVADAGPLGYTAIAAHGHADALSFTLSAGGAEFLVDPGTFAYHTEPHWRAYFRGTSAHNTLRVDGQDQSEPGGNFMWLHKARASCTRWSDTAAEALLEASHDGYLRLADPVLHRRRIVLDKRLRRVRIEDFLEMSGAHDIELYFHCSEHCSVEPIEGGYLLARGAKRVRLLLPQAPGATARLHRGSLEPRLGWVSRRFDERLASPTLAWRVRLEGDAVLVTEIHCGETRSVREPFGAPPPRSASPA